MKVKDVLEALKTQDPEDEAFMFFKTPDGNLTFSSEITCVSKGAIYDKYGRLTKGVLMMKEIENKK